MHFFDVINKFVSLKEGQIFTNNLFNETINIIELDEGFDGETLFLYIFLVAIVVLLLVAAQHFFSIFSSVSFCFSSFDIEFKLTTS